MEDCIFCKIISKETDAFIVYENDFVCCFLDKFPINKGHVLVIPKIHYQELTDVDEVSLSQIIITSKKIAAALGLTLNSDGITIMQNNGIFKDVEHYHMHIIPRFLNDGFSWVEPEINVPEEDFRNICSILVQRLK